MLEDLTREIFAECLGTTFRIHYGAASPLEVELIEATALPGQPRENIPLPNRQPFSLVFRGSKDGCLPQMMYPVEHDKLGTMDLFLVPIFPDQAGYRYEAIFN